MSDNYRELLNERKDKPCSEAEQRGGFNIWPYNNSKSMQDALDAARAILKKSDPTI